MNQVHVTLYNKNSGGRIKIWKCWVVNNKVCREWGIENGVMQYTEDEIKGKNIGRSNETTPEEQALLEFERIVRLKREEGYTESVKTLEKNQSADGVDWSTATLTPSFAPSKPEVSVEPEFEQSLISEKRAIYQRKHNGMRIFAVVGDNGKVNIYSRRIDDKTANFPQHVTALSSLPPRTVLDGEMVANDDPDLIKTIFGAKADKAIERQKTVSVDIVFFDLLTLDGQYYIGKEYAERYNKMQEIISKTNSSMLKVVENIPYQDKRPACPTDWEGMILKDAKSYMKIRLDGKPDRKSGSWKIKNFKEADLICYEWMTGKGKLQNDVATLKLGAYDSNGNFVHVCESGSGLDGTMRSQIRKAKMPIVIEVKYEEVTPAGSLRLPIVLRVRTDKQPAECLLSDIK